MYINDLMERQGMTKYGLAKRTGIAYATVSDICSGKSRIASCSGETLFKLAKGLGVTMEELVESSLERRSSFEAFKSATCHQVKEMGDLDFIIATLKSGRVIELWGKGWHAECLYLLAMLDYLCRENGLPLCREYGEMRQARLSEMLYPIGVLTLSGAMKSEAPKRESLKEAIPEFLRFNIVESEVRSVI